MRELFNCRSDWLFDAGAENNPAESTADEGVLLASDESDADEQIVLHATESEAEDVLFASDDEVEKPPAKRVQSQRRDEPARLLGKAVCVLALQSLLGYGTSTIQRIRNGEACFSRPKRPKHPTLGFSMDQQTSTKWPGVLMFFWKTYQSAAELMPTNFRMAAEAEFPGQDVTKRDEDYELRQVNGFLQNLHRYSSDLDIHLIGPGTFSGPCRYLQATTRTELYWEYVAASNASGDEPASYATFLRVANAIIKPGLRAGHLKFRGVNQHGQCNVCYELKTKIRGARLPDVRQELYRAYSQHLLSQWLDRQQYWSCRSFSHQWFTINLRFGERTLSTH